MAKRAGTGAAGFPVMERKLRLGIVGGGRGAFIGRVHANGAQLSNRWELVAGALSSDPAVARQSGAEWQLPPDRIYDSYIAMAEAEAARPDGIEAVAITTPNDSHHAICAAFMERGIDIICDKPLTTNLADALDLVARQRRTGLVFGVTHGFAAHAMVRQARAMVAAGELGEVRQVHVEFFQDWAMGPFRRDQKGARWRIDPKRSGPAFTTGDVGTHAHHLASFVSGLELTRLRAELHVCGAPKPLDDTAFMALRFAGEVPGTLMVSQAAAGNDGGLRIRVFGTKAGIAWDQELPELLHFNPVGGPRQVITRGVGAGARPEAERLVRVPRGHPEGWVDAWAHLYTELAVAIEARRAGRRLRRGLVDYPTVLDGARGVRFIEAAVQSHADGGTWVDCRLPENSPARPSPSRR
jgi:predicted dehydrogenase